MHYDTQRDQEGLDVHHDSCDITFNAALDEPALHLGLAELGLAEISVGRALSFNEVKVIVCQVRGGGERGCIREHAGEEGKLGGGG